MPYFSLSVAISLTFITAGTQYSILSHLKGKKFNYLLMGGALLFELFVNIIYMLRRADATNPFVTYPVTLKVLFMFHGFLSLIVFLLAITIFILALKWSKAGKNFFLEYKNFTYSFVGFWLFSLLSGEFMFIGLYFIR